MGKSQAASTVARIEALCRKSGLQLTEQRKIVLQLLCEADKPLSAYDLLDRMRDKVKNPTPPTVYRALDFLLKQGLAHKLESLHAYVGCAHPEHPHSSQFLICSDCGEVAEIEDKRISRQLQSVGKAAGFHAQRPVVEVLGTCAQCTGDNR